MSALVTYREPEAVPARTTRLVLASWARTILRVLLIADAVVAIFFAARTRDVDLSCARTGTSDLTCTVVERRLFVPVARRTFALPADAVVTTGANDAGLLVVAKTNTTRQELVRFGWHAAGDVHRAFVRDLGAQLADPTRTRADAHAHHDDRVALYALFSFAAMIVLGLRDARPTFVELDPARDRMIIDRATLLGRTVDSLRLADVTGVALRTPRWWHRRQTVRLVVTTNDGRDHLVTESGGLGSSEHERALRRRIDDARQA